MKVETEWTSWAMLNDQCREQGISFEEAVQKGNWNFEGGAWWREKKSPASQNEELLQSFVAFCREHPAERFWQALRNWSGHAFIYATDLEQGKFSDTFYWTGKKGNE